MRPFNIPCRFGTELIPFPLYVGEALEGVHPFEQQAAWLLRERGGVVPQDVMDAFQNLALIALEHGVSFEELCVQTWGEEQPAGGPDPAGPGAGAG